MTAISTASSFRKSRVLSIFEKQGLGIQEGFPEMSGSAGLIAAHCDSTVFKDDCDDAVIYFLPSPSPTAVLGGSRIDVQYIDNPGLAVSPDNGEPVITSQRSNKVRRVLGDEACMDRDGDLGYSASSHS